LKFPGASKNYAKLKTLANFIDNNYFCQLKFTNLFVSKLKKLKCCFKIELQNGSSVRTTLENKIIQKLPDNR